MSETASCPKPNEARAYPLDALRGLAILAMLLASQMPSGVNSLPSWMYHAQVPPPAQQFMPDLPGITWVDLVFPFFLFSMGAAFPLALGRRLRAGVSEWSLAGGIFKRGFLLGFFALFVDAIRPDVLSKHPSAGTWLLGLAGFLILFPILARLPEAWKPSLRWTIRLAGWAGAALFLALARYPGGGGFSLRRSDIITLHAPLTPDTKNMIGARELGMMKPHALLINTARGGLVDEAALAEALTAGKIGGAGFDELTVEPPKQGNILLDLKLPNLIITPHVAWASREAMQILADQLIDNVEAFAAGKPQNVVDA